MITIKVDYILAASLLWLLNYKKMLRREMGPDESATLHIVFNDAEQDHLEESDISRAGLIQDVNIPDHLERHPNAVIYEVIRVDPLKASVTFKRFA